MLMICYSCEKKQIINEQQPIVTVSEWCNSLEQIINCIHCGAVHKLCFTLKSLRDDYRDPHWLREHYVDKEYSMAAIAAMCAVTPMTIQNWLRRHDIPTRGRGYRANGE